MSNKNMTSLSAKKLFTEWLSHGLIANEDQAKLEDFSVNQQLEHEQHLYLRILVGIGAFIASLCFIKFLNITIFFFNRPISYQIFLGVLFISCAILLVKLAINKNTLVKHNFLIHVSCCFMITGKILLIAGLQKLFNPNEPYSLIVATLIATLATYHIYKISIDRFLSPLIFLTSTFFILFKEISAFSIFEVCVNLFFVSQLIIAMLLITNGKIKREHVPLSYACIFSLCLIVVYLSTGSKLRFWGPYKDFNLAVVNFSLAIAIIALIAWAAGEVRKLKSEPLSMASVGAIMLGVISAPGILLSIGFMILGYAKHERLILLLSSILLPLFLFLYYYNLDLTLIKKSGILIANGVLILSGRIYMHYRGIDKEVT